VKEKKKRKGRKEEILIIRDKPKKYKNSKVIDINTSVIEGNFFSF
jgi:hypothetical protein